jgi:hypothetical protein
MARRSPSPVRLLTTFAIALTAGCHEAVTAPPAYEVHVASPDVWSGSEVRLVSDLFTQSDTLLTVTLDSIPLALRRVDDTTLAAQFPDLVGEHRLAVTSPGVSISTTPDLVRLYGYRDRFEGPPLKGNLFAWPEQSGQPMVLGVGPSGLIHYDLASRAVARSWPDSVYSTSCGLSGPGTTWRTDTFVLQGWAAGECSTFHLWQLLPAAVLLPDSGPDLLVRNGFWVTAEIAPGRWMAGTDGDLFVFDCRTGPCSEVWSGRAWSAIKAVISPRGDRVIPVSSGLIQVIDPERLDYVWRYTGLEWVSDGVFTAEGDTLFLVGSDTTGQEVLIAARADDGGILVVTPLSGPDGRAFTSTAIAFDPLAPWIYVAGEVKADTMRTAALVVVDHRTLAQVAVLQSDHQFSHHQYPYDQVAIVPAPLAGTVFVVGSYYRYDAPVWPTPVYRYDRIP